MLEDIIEGLSELLKFHDYRTTGLQYYITTGGPWTLDKLDVSVDSDRMIQEYRQTQKIITHKKIIPQKQHPRIRGGNK